MGSSAIGVRSTFHFDITATAAERQFLTEWFVRDSKFFRDGNSAM
jgi:hypothetical protein